MNKEQLQAEIAAQKLLVKACKEHFQQAESDLALLEDEIPDKPELRHWDLAEDCNGDKHIMIADKHANVHAAGPNFICLTEPIERYRFTKIGNLKDIFDDLKARAEDLTEIVWEAEGYSYSAKIDKDGDLRITCPQLTDKRMIVEKVGFPAFIRNLQRLQATAGRNK